jgi:hypothetical protein
LKANQGALYEQVADFMQRNKPWLVFHRQMDKAHGEQKSEGYRLLNLLL